MTPDNFPPCNVTHYKHGKCTLTHNHREECQYERALPGTLVGVYGSLRQGMHNHHLLEEAEYVGKGHVLGRMFSLGSFPGAVQVPDGGPTMVVEVYEVSPETLADLDQLEGHPRWYKRNQVDVTGLEGLERQLIWVYYLPSTDLTIQACLDTKLGKVVEKGDWVEYLSARRRY